MDTVNSLQKAHELCLDYFHTTKGVYKAIMKYLALTDFYQ